jgi:uncharacterized membrane protein YkvA (DUF1232 family)
MKGLRFAALGAVWRALRAGHRPGTPGIGDRIRALPRLVTSTVIGRYTGLSRGRLLVVAIAVLYVVSPVDLVPELFVPLLGLIDDAFVVAWLAGVLLLETERFITWERSRVVVGQVVR